MITCLALLIEQLSCRSRTTVDSRHRNSLVVFSSFHELIQSRGVRRLSVRPSVNFFANRFFSRANGRIVTKLAHDGLQVASFRGQKAGSPPNMHTMDSRSACIQGVLKVKVKVKGHVIRALLCRHENRFFSRTNGRIATKLAHNGLQVSVHPGCAQGQGQGQRSRDTGIFVLARKSLLFAVKRRDRHQTCTRWTPGQRASRMCSRSRSRSKVT